MNTSKKMSDLPADKQRALRSHWAKSKLAAQTRVGTVPRSGVVTEATNEQAPSLRSFHALKDPRLKTAYWRKNKLALIEENQQINNEVRASKVKAKMEAKKRLFREQAIARGYKITS